MVQWVFDIAPPEHIHQPQLDAIFNHTWREQNPDAQMYGRVPINKIWKWIDGPFVPDTYDALAVAFDYIAATLQTQEFEGA